MEIGNLPQVPFVDLLAEYRSIQAEVDAAIAGVLCQTDFILGREVELFEREFAAYCGAGQAVAVDSGLSALELLLRGHGMGPGDEVITQANTFIASALAISATGARPVLVDIDSSTYNMDLQALELAITPRTAAILPVHLYGQPVDMDAVLKIADRVGVPVIEDACQAHGAKWRGQRVGSIGSGGAFSFYPAKNLGCYGDGGIVVTQNSEIAAYVRKMRNYGQSEKYHHEIAGSNRRLDTLQAAVLRVKLTSLDARNQARRRCAALYKELLKSAPVILPNCLPHAEHVWHLFVIRCPDRDGLRNYLTRQGVATGLHYPIPIHLQKAYADLGYNKGAFPACEGAAREVLSLPMYPELTPEAIQYVAKAVCDFYASSLYRPLRAEYASVQQAQNSI